MRITGKAWEWAIRKYGNMETMDYQVVSKLENLDKVVDFLDIL
jgi:hypothetical protein